MTLILSSAFWTFWFLVFSFPVTLVVTGVAVAMRLSRSGRALHSLGPKAALFLLSPMICVVLLWTWAAVFAGHRAPNGGYDSPALRAAAGWRHLGIYALFGMQALVVVALPLRLPTGRLAAYAYGALQLWIGAMAAMVAHFAVLGLPVPAV